MKRTSFKFFTIAIIAMVFLSSCERVAPNYAGVLMENYGKQGKEDFKVVSGRVSTWECEYFKSRYSTNEASSEALSR